MEKQDSQHKHRSKINISYLFGHVPKLCIRIFVTNRLKSNLLVKFSFRPMCITPAGQGGPKGYCVHINFFKSTLCKFPKHELCTMRHFKIWASRTPVLILHLTVARWNTQNRPKSNFWAKVHISVTSDRHGQTDGRTRFTHLYPWPPVGREHNSPSGVFFRTKSAKIIFFKGI